MDEGEDAEAYLKSLMESKKDNEAYKRRKVVEKTVVKVRVGENTGKQKGEGSPSDSWSWRKYGQKPIKGSPYPRSYYRCSTSKGCSAKKQVERCRTDGSIFIITYTSAHNHTTPDTCLNKSTQHSHECQPITAPDPPIINEKDSNVNSHFQSPVRSPSATSHHSPPKTLEKAHNNSLCILDSPSTSMTCSTLKSEENDFFDELEDLPISSSFTSLMRSFLDERIILA